MSARNSCKRYLNNLQIAIHERNGIDYLVSFTPKTPIVLRETYVYQPRYRSVEYLSDLLRSQFDGNFNSPRSGISVGQIAPEKAVAGTASDFLNRTGDVLVYYGTKADIARLKVLLPKIDTVTDEVVVSAYVFEVQTTERNGSGLALDRQKKPCRFVGA